MLKYRRHTEHTRTSLFAAAMAAGLALALTGCESEEIVMIGSERFAMPSDDVLLQDASYMIRLFEEKRGSQPFITLDLADQRQYASLIHGLLHAGKTPSNSPRLFEVLGQARAKHLAGLEAPGSTGEAKTVEAVTASAAGGGGTRCGNFVIAQGRSANGTFQADSHSLISCRAGMDYMWMRQTIYQANEDGTQPQLLSDIDIEGFGGIELRTPKAQASVPAGTGKVVYVKSEAIAYDNETGDLESLEALYKTEADSPAGIRTNAGGDSCDAGGCCQFDHPRDSTGDGRIRLCYQRSQFVGVGDCDYVAVNALNQPGIPPYTHIAMIQVVAGLYVPSLTERWPIPNAPVASVPNLFLPMMGMFDAGTRLSNGQQCDIKGFVKNDTWAALTLKSTGGWCSAEGVDGSQLWENLQTNLDTLDMQNGSNRINEVPFGVDIASLLDPPNLLADFGADCLENLQEACMVVNIAARTDCNDTSTPGKQFTRTATCEVCFDVRNSCFAAGTMIRRADGTIVPVETIQPGDEIVANEAGTVVTVTAAARGVEPEPMVRLKDSLGHELMLTSKHPVITTLGAVPAEQITTMSQVQTEDGIASIVEVERVRYDGIVYNLSVGTPEEIAMVSGLNRTLFAGGIRVGDNEMQFEMERESTRASAVRKPSPAWETDRKNAMKRERRGKK